MSKIYYLGPEGSNTHIAAIKFSEKLNDKFELIYVHNILQGFKEYLAETEKSYLVLPLENSIEGTVRETIDNLILQNEDNLKIFAEIIVDIRHCFVGHNNTDLSSVKTVISHPQAILQCIDTIYQIFGNDVKIINSTSTSKAVKSLDEADLTTIAIANPLCAEIYNKKVLKYDVSKVLNNKTRFVVIDKFASPSYHIKPSKVSITFSTKNQAGALASVLDVLAYYGINLLHIDSRPSKIKFGEYIFYSELDTNFENNNLEIALNKIKNYTNYLKINGEYFSI